MTYGEEEGASGIAVIKFLEEQKRLLLRITDDS